MRPNATSGALSEARAILRIGWPIMGAQLLWLSMVFVDNVLVGRLGAKPLASLAIASGLFGIFSIVMIGVLSVASSLIADARGAGDDQRVRALAKQALIVGQLIAASVIVAATFAQELLDLLGQDPSLTGDAELYLRALSWGLPFQALYNSLRQIADGHQDTKPSLVIASIAAVCNYVLDQVLIYGWGPIPSFGLEGAGYATAAVSTIMSLAFIAYISCKKSYRHLDLMKRDGWTDTVAARDIARIGLPVSAALLAEMGFFVAGTFIVGSLDATLLAAHQMALNAASFTFMLPLGLSFAVSIRIGHHSGRGDAAGLRATVVSGVAITLLIATSISSVFILAPRSIASLYTSEPHLTALALPLLMAAGLFQIFDCLQVIGMGILRGMRAGRAALLNSVVAFWIIGFPAGYSLAIFANLDAIGVWYGLMIGLGAASALHGIAIVERLRASSKR